MLTDRQLLILKWIVEEYVRTAEPVGSKSLAGLPDFDLSSATIRNEMAVLEDEGLIIKTHTSSGRIPSEKGYKLYVSLVIDSRNEQTFPMIDEIFNKYDSSKDEAIKETMSLVSKLTNYASVAMGRSAYDAHIKNLQIVRISEHSAVMIMVTNHGYVESKRITIPDDISFKDINKVVNLLNELLHDCPISDIDAKLKETLLQSDLKTSIEYYDEIIGVFVRAVSQMAQDKFFMSGQTNILNLPEFQDVDKVRDLLNVMDKDQMFKLMSLDNQGITVKIGQENKIKAMENCTIITVPYESLDGQKGAIAVIGPTRMEYQKVIPLLDYIAKYLGKYK